MFGSAPERAKSIALRPQSGGMNSTTSTWTFFDRSTSKRRLIRSRLRSPTRFLFAEDHKHASYDKESAQSLLAHTFQRSDTLFKRFRADFLGKSSPVHFFWGSFDLAVTRFSGRPAPPRPGADAITREAYSHEVISAGFWPGNGGFGAPGILLLCRTGACRTSKSNRFGRIRPSIAMSLKNSYLKYDDVRQANSPDTRRNRIPPKLLRSRGQAGRLGSCRPRATRRHMSSHGDGGRYSRLPPRQVCYSFTVRRRF